MDSFYAYDRNFPGGVSVATADLSGTGTLGLLLGGGAGQASVVKAMQASPLTTVQDFTAFDPSFLGGVYVG